MSGYADPPVATRFKPGQSGNPAGRPVGRRSLATIIKDLLEGELDFSKLDTAEAAKLAEMYKGKSAWEAITYVAVIKALNGNIQASEWLAKNAYGSRMTITADLPTTPLSDDLAHEIAREREIIRLGEEALTARELAEGGNE